MHLKLILIFITFISYGHASELKVQDGLRSFSLSYGNERIELLTANMNLTLTQRKCNESIIRKFNQRVSGAIKRAVKHTSNSISSVKVELDSRSFYISRASAQGKFLVLIPEEIKRIKIEAALKCK